MCRPTWVRPGSETRAEGKRDMERGIRSCRSAVSRSGARRSRPARMRLMVFVSGMPPFDPETCEIAVLTPFERQDELVLESRRQAPTSITCSNATCPASRPSASKPSTQSTSVIFRKLVCATNGLEWNGEGNETLGVSTVAAWGNVGASKQCMKPMTDLIYPHV